jgi:hypothetical protein
MTGLLKYFNEVIAPQVEELDKLLKMTDAEYIASLRKKK